MEQNQVQNIPQELFVRVDNNTINSEKLRHHVILIGNQLVEVSLEIQ